MDQSCTVLRYQQQIQVGANTGAQLFAPFQDILTPKDSQGMKQRKRIKEGMKPDKGRNCRESMMENEACIQSVRS